MKEKLLLQIMKNSERLNTKIFNTMGNALTTNNDNSASQAMKSESNFKVTSTIMYLPNKSVRDICIVNIYFKIITI